MMEWDALIQTLISSSIVAGGLSFVFKQYTEKRIEHVFDKKLKEYEAKLQEATALNIGIGTDRIEEYKKLSALVNSIRKHAVVLSANPHASENNIGKLNSEAKKLENLIYEQSITLYSDRVYEQVHSYKVQVVNLIKNIENEQKLRVTGKSERADGVKEVVDRSIREIETDCRSIVDLLVTLVTPKNVD